MSDAQVRQQLAALLEQNQVGCLPIPSALLKNAVFVCDGSPELTGRVIAARRNRRRGSETTRARRRARDQARGRSDGR